MHPAFLLVLKTVACLALLGSLLLAVKSQDSLADIPEVGYKVAEVEQVEPETAFVGSSHTYRHVDIALFDSLRGGTSYNLGLRAADAVEIHYQAERALRLPSLRQLVVELRTVGTDAQLHNRRSRRAYYHHDLRHARLAARATLALDLPLSERLGMVRERYGVALDHYMMTGQGDALIAGRVYESAPYSPGERHGFASLGGVAGDQERRAEFLSSEGQADFAERVRRLRQRASAVPTRADSVMADVWLDLYRRAAAQGVEVVFVEQVGEQEGAGVARLLAEVLPPERLLIFNDPDRYPELFDVDVWFDRGHLNERGARHLTELLAARLPAA